MRIAVSGAGNGSYAAAALRYRPLEGIGKVPVVCAAAPGFIVPRIPALAMYEAARLVEEGLATAEDIDKATRYGLGFRYAAMGILEFIDYSGGDMLYYASRSLAAAMGDPRFAAPPSSSATCARAGPVLRAAAVS